MNENHPIDELFKSLSEAEIAPPATVWENIAAHGSWSARMLESLRKYWWVPLLFLTGAGVGYVVMDNGNSEGKASGQALVTESGLQGDRSATDSQTSANEQSEMQEAQFRAGRTQQSSEPTTLTSSEYRSHSSEIAPQEEASNARSGSIVVRQNAEAASLTTSISPKGDSENTQRGVAVSGSSVATDRTPESNSGVADNSASDQPAEGNAQSSPLLASLNSNPFNPSTGPAGFMDFRLIDLPERNIRRIAPRGGGDKGRGAGGTIPPGDWWIGGSLNYSILELSHEGTDRSLQNALNDAEKGDHAISLEMLGGRIWRNGFFISAGIGTEALTSSFNFSSNKLTVVDSVYTYQDTNNVTVSDTVQLFINSTSSTRSTNRYNIFRVPFRGGWIKEIGRFEIGPQVGLVMEFGTSRKGYSLARETSAAGESEFIARTLDDASFNKRYGVGLSGTAALQVGFKVSEFWSVWMLPEYTSRLSTFSNDPMSIQADRAGVRFGFRYTIPY